MTGVARAGFSLIELLASMAVVAVLVSILVPSLAGARESARAAACHSNLRQLAIALAAYAGDARGFAPPAAADFASNLRRWHGSRSSAGGVFDQPGPLSPYLDEHSGLSAVRACPTFAPALESLRASRRGFEQRCGGYGYNAAYLGTLRGRAGGLITDRSGSPLAHFAAPSRTLAFADAAFEDSGTSDSGVMEYSFIEPRFWPEMLDQRADPSMHFRHAARADAVGGCVAVKLDGHASTEQRTFTWRSGIYGPPPRVETRTGWTGTTDDNALFAFD